MHLLAGSAGRALAAGMADALARPAAARSLERFPDGELHVAVHDDVRDGDVYLVQSLGPPTQEHLIELLLLADAADRAGAARITAVVPYLAYARQDRRTAPGEPVALRVVADLLDAAAIDRLVVVDPHTPDVEAIFSVEVEAVSAVDLLARALDDDAPPDPVLVAPDLGAVKLAERYADHLDWPVVVVRKSRRSGSEVEASGVVGEVAGRTPVVVDDMISTGGTLAAAVERCLEAGAREDVRVAATHGLLVGPAAERLGALPLRRLLISDAVEPGVVDALPLERVGLAPRLAEVVRRLHEGIALGDLALHR